MRSSAVLIPVLAVAVAAQGFYDECSQTWSLGWHGRSWFAVATCPASSSSARITSALSLQDCLGNSEGTMQAGKGSHAFSSCSGCTASTNSSVLSCSCQNSHGASFSTSIDLNTVLSNTDGILSCYGQPGIEIPTA